MINMWMTTLLKYAAFGGELPSCDFLTGTRGYFFLISSCHSPTPTEPWLHHCHRRVLGAQPLPGPRGTGQWLQPVPGPWPPAGELGLFCPIAMAITAPAHLQHVGHPTGVAGTNSLVGPRGAAGSYGKQRGAWLLPDPQHPGALRDWLDFGTVLFWKKVGKKINNTAASCVTFSYQVISIFNSETACISIFSLFITLHFVFCIVTVVFCINFA